MQINTVMIHPLSGLYAKIHYRVSDTSRKVNKRRGKLKEVREQRRPTLNITCTHKPCFKKKETYNTYK